MAWFRCVSIGVVGGWMLLSVVCAFPTYDVWRVQPGQSPALPGDGAGSSDDCSSTAAVQSLTLTQAIARALCANPQTRQSWAKTQVHGAQIGQADAAYLPNVSASVNRSLDELVIRAANGASTETSINAHDCNATLNRLLLDFGARAASVEQAKQGLNVAVASHDAAI